MMSSMMLNDLKQNNYAPPLILPFNPKYFHEGIEKTSRELLRIDAQYELNVILNQD
jgi:hypothetical protein